LNDDGDGAVFRRDAQLNLCTRRAVLDGVHQQV
jgi:hypothetical protein